MAENHLGSSIPVVQESDSPLISLLQHNEKLSSSNLVRTISATGVLVHYRHNNLDHPPMADREKGSREYHFPIRPRFHNQVPRWVKPGILGRISPCLLSEWHAFGIISRGKDKHMMLAGAVGDYTKSLVATSEPLLGPAGPFRGAVLLGKHTNVCILWVTKGIEQNFGKEIKEMMSGHPQGKVIVHDTAVSGQPNVAAMSVDGAKGWRAEVVIVTSNPEGSRDVVNACKAKGIAAFGPIWDS
ncbi:hypothetical protein MLD38_027561 [Melastoma candidum]|uniref:Uncharacterized protein n=1 Tax=Melastoma candidum TaxID=119954 RepID=A0ACB9P534_9MYRT|nr:hypothetical protein MLD38_027561 [Melastoma candidum]